VRLYAGPLGALDEELKSLLEFLVARPCSIHGSRMAS